MGGKEGGREGGREGRREGGKEGGREGGRGRGREGCAWRIRPRGAGRRERGCRKGTWKEEEKHWLQIQNVDSQLIITHLDNHLHPQISFLRPFHFAQTVP